MLLDFLIVTFDFIFYIITGMMISGRLGLLGGINSFPFCVSIGYLLGSTLYWFLFRYISLLIKKAKISLIVTYLVMLISLVVCWTDPSVSVASKDLWSMCGIFLFSAGVYLCEQKKIGALRTMDPIMDCIGSAHTKRYTNLALYMKEHDVVPVTGQCMGQGFIEYVYTAIGLKKGYFHIFLHTVYSIFITNIFVYFLLQQMNNPNKFQWLAVVSLFILNISSVSLGLKKSSPLVAGSSCFLHTFFDLQQAFVGILFMLMIAYHMVDVPVWSGSLVLFLFAAIWNYTGPQFTIYGIIQMGLLFLQWLIGWQDVFYWQYAAAFVVGMCLSVLGGGMFTPSFLYKHDNVRGMLTISGKCRFIWGLPFRVFDNHVKHQKKMTTKFLDIVSILFYPMIEGVFTVVSAVILFKSGILSQSFLLLSFNIFVMVAVCILLVYSVKIVGFADDEARIYESGFVILRVVFCIMLCLIFPQLGFWMQILTVVLVVATVFTEFIRMYLRARGNKKYFRQLFSRLGENAIYCPMEKLTKQDWFAQKKVAVDLTNKYGVYWSDIKKQLKQGKKIMLYGAGYVGHNIILLLEEDYAVSVECFIDSSKEKIGTLYEGKEVKSLEKICADYQKSDIFVLISVGLNSIAVIAERLEDYGIKDYGFLCAI